MGGRRTPTSIVQACPASLMKERCLRIRSHCHSPHRKACCTSPKPKCATPPPSSCHTSCYNRSRLPSPTTPTHHPVALFISSGTHQNQQLHSLCQSCRRRQVQTQQCTPGTPQPNRTCETCLANVPVDGYTTLFPMLPQVAATQAAHHTGTGTGTDAAALATLVSAAWPACTPAAAVCTLAAAAAADLGPVGSGCIGITSPRHLLT